jgi:hypothetical protein
MTDLMCSKEDFYLKNTFEKLVLKFSKGEVYAKPPGGEEYQILNAESSNLVLDTYTEADLITKIEYEKY